MVNYSMYSLLDIQNYEKPLNLVGYAQQLTTIYSLLNENMGEIFPYHLTDVLQLYILFQY